MHSGDRELLEIDLPNTLNNVVLPQQEDSNTKISLYLYSSGLVYLQRMVCSDSGANSYGKGLTDSCHLDF